MLKLGILGSGTGTNFDAICGAIDKGELHAEIVVVLSDKEEAPILEKARVRNIPAYYLDPGPFKTKLDRDHEMQYIRLLKEFKVEYIILAGFMRVIKDCFFEHFDMRILNIHPSLLPSFPGLEAWKQALYYGVKITGCSVHFVSPELDAGPIILQASVPVFQDDNPEKLHQRIHLKEYEIYPKAIELLSQRKIRLEGRQVFINP